MGDVVKMVDSRESLQTARFKWREGASAFYVDDTETGATKCMGDGVDMFCNEDGTDCLVVGTARFYNAMNDYFENEQAEIAKAYFDLDLEKGARQIG